MLEELDAKSKQVNERIEVVIRDHIQELEDAALELVDAYWQEWKDKKPRPSAGKVTPRFIKTPKYFRIVWEKRTMHFSGKGSYAEYIRKPKNANYNLGKLFGAAEGWEAPIIESYELRFAKIRDQLMFYQGILGKIEKQQDSQA